MRQLISLPFVLGPVGALPALADDTPLGKDVLAELYNGNSVDGFTGKLEPYRAYHSKDGKISAIASGKYKNKGTWAIADPDMVCIDWNDKSWATCPATTSRRTATCSRSCRSIGRTTSLRYVQ